MKASIQWTTKERVVSLLLFVSKPPQVKVRWNKNGAAVIQKAEYTGSFPVISSASLTRNSSVFKEAFFPVVAKLSDGNIAVSFYVRGLGGGGVCCKESDEVEQPLLTNSPPKIRVVPAAPNALPAAISNADKARIEERLSVMRESTLKNFSENLDTYVPVVEQSEDRTIDLSEEADHFLRSQQLVFLVTGSAGSGKSLFLEHLAWKLWQDYRPNNPIPIWISLPSLEDPIHNVVEEALKQHGFSASEIAYLVQHRQFVFLLDGYDETGTDRNLFLTNRLDRLQAKVLIACRSQYLPDHYQDSFVPHVEGVSKPGLLREKTISPFDSERIDQYLQLQIGRNQTAWKNWRDCRNCIDSIPTLLFLVQNPFILKIVVQMLPEVLERYAKLEADECSRLTRRELYRLFVQEWFERQQNKLVQAKRIDPDCDMRPKFFEFCKKLAHAMQKKGVYSVAYDEERSLFEEHTIEWQPFFSQEDVQIELVRSGCPLRKAGNRWSFIHATVLEFFCSEKIFESMAHLDIQGNDERRATILQAIPNLNNKNLINEPLILQFSADRARVDKVFRQALFDIVHLSAKDPDIAAAAANAMTILNRAEISFTRMEFVGIRIPDADLSRAIFDGTRFINCDLRGVRLANAFIKDTSFTGSQMEGVVLGQRDFIAKEKYIARFTLSPKWIALRTDGPTVHIYDRKTHLPVRTLRFKWSDSSDKLEFSPGGDYLVVSCCNNSKGDGHWINFFPTAVVRTDTWEIRYLGNPDGWNGSCPAQDFVFVDPHHILSATFKRGDYASQYCQYQIWDIRHENSSSKSFNIERGGHINVSHNGRSIAFYTKDRTLCVQRVSDKKIVAKTQETKFKNRSFFALSPDGSRLAYIADDNLVIYDVGRNKVLKTIPSFPGVECLTFSPNGEEVAASTNHQITIWNIEQEKEIARISGHRGPICKLQFSEDSRFIYSSANDHTLRVREISHFKSFLGHESVWIKKVSASSEIIGGINPETYRSIRFWRMGTGETEAIFTPFKPREGFFRFLYLSRSGKRFVTKGNTQRKPVLTVWDMETKSVIKQISVAMGNYMNAMTLSWDDRFVATTDIVGNDSPVKIWDLDSGTLRHDIRLPAKIGANELGMGAYSLEFSPNGEFLAIVAATMGSREHEVVQIYSLKSKSVIKTFNGSPAPVIFSPDSKYFILTDHKKNILFYELASEQIEFMLQAHQHGITALAISPDGRILASGDCKGNVFLYDLVKRQVVTGFAPHLEWVVGLWFDETGQKLASHALDRMVRTWNLYNANMELDPRLCWSSNKSFYAREVTLGETIGLSPENETLLQQVDLGDQGYYSMELPVS